MTAPHLMAPLALLAFCVVPSTLGAAPATPAPALASLDELKDLVVRGECTQALAKAKALQAARPKDPDPLVIEANCQLRDARRTEQVFDAARFDRYRLSRGASVKRGDEQQFFRPRDTYDQPKLEQALALFRKALALAPGRADLVVGNIAVLANVGRTQDGVALLATTKPPLGEGALNDLGRTVQDLLGAGSVADAQVLARGLAAAYPRSGAAHWSLALVAQARHDTPAALEQLLLAKASEPDNPKLTRDIARLQLFSRHWSDAVVTLAPVVGDSAEFLYWMALARMRTTPAAAIDLFRQLRERVAKSGAKENDPLMKITTHYVRALSDQRQATVAMRLRAANEFASWGLVLSALAELDDAVAQDERSTESWVRMADLYRGAELFDLAAGALDRALAAVKAAGPTGSAYSEGELQLERARVLIGLDRDGDAAGALSAARAAGRPAPYEEGVIALAAGRKAQARKLFEEAAAGTGDTAGWAKAKLAHM